MTCAVVTTDNTQNGKAGRSYWFPVASNTELNAIAGGTYNVWNDVTSHLVDSKLGAMARWQVLNISATKFQAAKFQPKGPVITENTTDDTIFDFWKTQKDYRFEGGDQVDVYQLFEDASGNMVWNSLLGRTLQGATGLAVSAATATFVTLANLI